MGNLASLLAEANATRTTLILIFVSVVVGTGLIAIGIGAMYHMRTKRRLRQQDDELRRQESFCRLQDRVRKADLAVSVAQMRDNPQPPPQHQHSFPGAVMYAPPCINCSCHGYAEPTCQSRYCNCHSQV